MVNGRWMQGTIIGSEKTIRFKSDTEVPSGILIDSTTYQRKRTSSNGRTNPTLSIYDED